MSRLLNADSSGVGSLRASANTVDDESMQI